MAGKYLTPDVPEGDDIELTRSITLPSFALPFLYGALQELARESSWEKHGEKTAAEMAALFFDAIEGIS